MPRQARVVIPGYPHHVTQRGNNRQDVFFVDDDRQRYLALLARESEEFGLRIDAYCLMTNHVHLVATPTREESLAKAIGRANLYYARHVNRLHGRSGHLWQDRFFSSCLDDEYFWNAAIYVERNPVRAGLISRAWDWPWSSARAHVTGDDRTGMLDLRTWRDRLAPGSDWREAISKPQDEAMENRLRTWSHRGCPLGSDSFVAKLEARLNRRLRPGTPGRPRRRRAKDVPPGWRPQKLGRLPFSSLHGGAVPLINGLPATRGRFGY